jgi:N-acetylmuramoyl-L-alanine amidase
MACLLPCPESVFERAQTKRITMKLSPIALWVSALFVGLAPDGHSDPARSATPSSEWVSLAGWARENNYELAWAKKEEDVTFRKETSTLSFKKDSPLAEINGIKVWLCDPVAFRDGQGFISSLDLQSTLQPILFAATNRSSAPLDTICLDPGHGGKDSGGQVGKFLEKQFTLLLAREVEKQFRAAGFKVVLTRTRDKYVELDDRPALAKQNRADLFISLHFNVDPQGEASGVEVYCLTPAKAASTNGQGKPANTEPLPGNRRDPQNVLLGYQLQKSLVDNLGAEDRGLHRARFAVLRAATMPAVLIEGGFLSNASDREKIADPKYRVRMAKAIAQGVLAYKHIIRQ